MLKWLQLLINPAARAACVKAKALVAQDPARTVEWAALRADEADRWVFAVFHDNPALPDMPSPYKLIAVSKHSGDTEELRGAAAKPYRLRGYK